MGALFAPVKLKSGTCQPEAQSHRLAVGSPDELRSRLQRSHIIARLQCISAQEQDLVRAGMGLAVIGLLFQYLGMLQKEGLQGWAYAELAAIAATKFQWANEEEACDYVTRLAADMLHYEPQHTLNADSLYEGWNAELVSAQPRSDSLSALRF